MKKTTFFAFAACCAFFNSGESAGAALQDNLTAFYPFSGSADDATGDGYDGSTTSVSATTDRFGTPNAAFNFDGTSSVIEVSKLFAMGGQQTFVEWLKPNDLPTVSGILEKAVAGYGGETDFFLEMGADGRLRWLVNTDDGYTGLFAQALGGTGLSINRWSCVATVIDQPHNQIRLYVNGVLDAVADMGGRNVRNTNRPYRIGKRIGNQSSAAFNGGIDDVRIYNRVLTDGEISTLANPSGSLSPNIVIQPKPRVIQAGSQTMFSVVADGAEPLAYQWRRNGLRIDGATGPLLNFTDTTTADSGRFSVVVQNSYGSITSSNVPLYVYSPVVGPPPNVPATTTAQQALSSAQTKKPRVPSNVQLQSFGSSALVDPSKMTIVMTHGWNSDAFDWPLSMANALKEYITAHPGTYVDDHPNILAWNWYENASINPIDPVASANRTPSEGAGLGRALMDTLGPSYNQPIHFIGHSLGTLVNCAAADYIHGDRRPRGDTRSPSQTYSPANTQMTLLDEAELVTAVKGLHVSIDVLRAQTGDLGGLNDAYQQVNNFWSKVLPDHARWSDNYLSEVGLLHSDSTNVMLWRATATRPPTAAHGYAYYWYQQTITNPLPELMGHRWSFERKTIPGQPATATYYLQDLNAATSELNVTAISGAASTALVGLHVVGYPTLQAYKGLSAIGKGVEGIYINTIEYAGNIAANFAQSIFLPNGSPVYLGTSGSTPAFYTDYNNAAGSGPQATWDLQFSLQPGTPQQSNVNPSIRAKAVSAASSPNAIYTIIPIHIPSEAVGISFEYQITGAAVEDFMTMGIADQNNYTIEAKFVDDGVWNGTPAIQISDYRNQDVQLVFALNGSDGAPTGTLGIRNVQFYIPPKPELSIAMAGRQATLSWPLSATSWTLEASPLLSDPNGWQTVNGVPDDGEYFHSMTFDAGTTASSFFRLKK